MKHLISKAVIFRNIHVWVYLSIFIVLWFTKGMTEPHQTGFPIASFTLFIAFLLLVIDAFIPLHKTIQPTTFKPEWILTILLIFFCIANFNPKYSIYHFSKTIHINLFHTSFFICMGIGLFTLVSKKFKAIATKVLFLAGSVFTFIIIYCSFETGIDTHLFLNMASDYFLDGKNPYQYNYPDIYRGRYADVYGDKFYFNYWPFPLYLVAGFRWLFGDVRYAFVACQVIAGWLIINSRKSISLESSIILAMLWILNMVVNFVNERSWLDALVTPFFIGGIMMVQKNKFGWAAILFGLMASVKLYYVFIFPFIGIYFLKERKIKEIFLMGLAFIIPFIPFLLWSFHDFYYSSFTFISNTEVREDSLSLISAIKKLYHVDYASLGTIIMFACMAIFLVMFLVGRNSALNMVKYINLCLFAIFLFSKQAFCNYFYFNMLCSLIILHLQANYKDVEKEKY